MWPYSCPNLHCNKPCYTKGMQHYNVTYRVRKGGVIWEHIGCGPKWTIWVSPDAPSWGDSKSGGPKLIPFLIRQENTKYLWKAGVKFDLLCFGQFNLYQDPFFEGIVNLATELLYLAWNMCYIQNGDWGPGSWSGNVLWLWWFNFCLDQILEENPYPNREIWNSHHGSWYGQINNSGWNEDYVTFSKWDGLTFV